MKNKRRKPLISNKKVKKTKQSNNDFSDDEPNFMSETGSDSDENFSYKEEKLQFDNDVEEILPINDEESEEEPDEESDITEHEDESEGAVDLISEEHASDEDQEYASDDKDAGPLEAWGKKKKTFFSTDFIDEDRGKSYREDDMENAKTEEMDALAIHKSFLGDVYSSTSKVAFDDEFLPSKETPDEDNLKLSAPDWKIINKKEKLQLLQKQSPEFISVMTSFKAKLTELNDRISPLMNLLKTSQNSVPEYFINYVLLKNKLLSDYCTTASFYMILRSLNIPATRHPVIKRLKEFENLLDSLRNLDSALKSGIDEILKNIQKSSDATQLFMKKIFIDDKSIQNRTSVNHDQKTNSQGIIAKEKIKNQSELTNKQDIIADYTNTKKQQKEKQEENVDIQEMEDVDNDVDENAKRTISYQIAKNKGLIPRRKKEYRNPRVKHRMKFKKAQIRRKGQVRLPRKELKKYGGEISGISSHVSKSIKIK